MTRHLTSIFRCMDGLGRKTSDSVDTFGIKDEEQVSGPPTTRVGVERGKGKGSQNRLTGHSIRRDTSTGSETEVPDEAQSKFN